MSLKKIGAPLMLPMHYFNTSTLERFLATIFRNLAAVRAEYPVGYGDMDTAIGYQLDTVSALRAGDRERVLGSMDRHLGGLEEHFLGQGIELRRVRPPR